MSKIEFVYIDALRLATNMINKMENIHKDDKGFYFYGGTKNNDIECDHNKTILEDNQTRLTKTFKYQKNWYNMRHSQKPVGNHLRFIFCKLLNCKTLSGITMRYGDYTCKKYYIPECVAVHIIRDI